MFGLEACRHDRFQEANASMRHTQKLSVATVRLEHKRGASSEKLNIKSFFYFSGSMMCPVCCRFQAHLDWEQAAEVVFPVVTSGNDDPLLHAVVLDGADGRSHVEVCCERRRKLVHPVSRPSFPLSHASGISPSKSFIFLLSSLFILTQLSE